MCGRLIHHEQERAAAPSSSSPGQVSTSRLCFQVDGYPDRTNNYLRQLDVYLHGKPNVVHIESAATLGGTCPYPRSIDIETVRMVGRDCRWSGCCSGVLLSYIGVNGCEFDTEPTCSGKYSAGQFTCTGYCTCASVPLTYSTKYAQYRFAADCPRHVHASSGLGNIWVILAPVSVATFVERCVCELNRINCCSAHSAGEASECICTHSGRASPGQDSPFSSWTANLR